MRGEAIAHGMRARDGLLLEQVGAGSTGAACEITVVSSGLAARDCLVHLLRGQPGLAATVDAVDGPPIPEPVARARRVIVLDARGPAEDVLAEKVVDGAGSGLVLIGSGGEDEAEAARTALRAGADAFVLADRLIDDLVPAVQSVIAGQSFVSPTVGALLALGEETPADEVLTERERAVLQLLGRGHTNAEAARSLFVSQRTVEAHRAAVQRKLGVSGRAELVAAARERGLV